MSEVVDKCESEEYPGLMVVTYPDVDYGESPLDWAEIREVGKGELSRDGRRDESPGQISCPKCDGEGQIGDDWCPDCGGICTREAVNAKEWCDYHGVAAAVPVSYETRYSQPWIEVRAWNESFDSILCLSDGDEDTIRYALTDTETAWTEGFHCVAVEIDPDSDLPDGMERVVEDSLCGILGWEGAESEAYAMLRYAESRVKKELADRESWAKRDVVTA